MSSFRCLSLLSGTVLLLAGCADPPPSILVEAPRAAAPVPEAGLDPQAEAAAAAAEAARKEEDARLAREAWFARAWAEAGIDPADYAARSDGGVVLPAIDIMKIDPAYLRQRVPFATEEAPGTIVVDTGERHLYLVEEGGMATRYGIAVGREGFGWSGTGSIGRTARWPRWTPPPEMIARDPKLAEWAEGMPGGPDNPLGARALYIYLGGEDSLYRIHGTNEPYSVGRAASSGCFRMLNQDAIDLHGRVSRGAKVIVR